MYLEENNLHDVTDIPTSFIYFLTDEDDEVVYVGKTSNGMSRIQTHKKEGVKQFSKVYALLCEEEELDELEKFYIQKYRPIYNSLGIYNNRVKLIDIGTKLIEELKLTRNFSSKQLHDIVYSNFIQVYYIQDVEYVTIEGYLQIKAIFEDLLKGAPQNDILFL